jgi:hypothetical protein
MIVIAAARRRSEPAVSGCRRGHHCGAPAEARASSERKNQSARIAELFAIANKLLGAYEGASPFEIERLGAPPSESEHLEAVNELLREFRSQWEKLGRKEISRIDPLLVQGIADWGFRIFSNPDPILALEYFLGKRQKRGKRANAQRNLQITLTVLEKMRAGTSLEHAAEAVAVDYGLKTETVIKIYTRNHVKAKAHLVEAAAHVAMNALERERQ